MSDHVKRNGKIYYEEAYLRLANSNTRRARGRIAELQAEIMRLRNRVKELRQLKMRKPYTLQELDELKKKLSSVVVQVESTDSEIKPLPPMAEQEALELLTTLTTVAVTRKLTYSESFLAGQLISNYRMAIEARMLGKESGRYFVVSQDDFERLLNKE